MLLFRACFVVLITLAITAGCAAAAWLAVPARPNNAANGAQVVKTLEPMPRQEREDWIYQEILSGNVPSWNRLFVPVPFSQTIGGSNYAGTLHVLPDYLAVGSDRDYLLIPMTPLLAQRLADRLDCILPTRKMVNLIWTNAEVKLIPQPIPPSEAMATVPVFAKHNEMVRAQRDQQTNSFPPGALVAGHKKDVVISSRVYTNVSTKTKHPVVIYGWHYPSGQPIQPLYNGHGDSYADYSHGIRLVLDRAIVNGRTNRVTELLKSPATAALLSDEGAREGTSDGVIAFPRYPVSEGVR